MLVDENAIQALYEYMEENPDVGMAGSRVYHMQMPDYIQQCGLLIDFDHCGAETLYADCLEDGTLPDVIECDTVATCSVMIRGSVIRQTDAGIMPEDNFIEAGHFSGLLYVAQPHQFLYALHAGGKTGGDERTGARRYI